MECQDTTLTGIIMEADAPPPVAVIVTKYGILVVLFFVATVNTVVLDPPAVRVTMDGLIEKVGGC